MRPAEGHNITYARLREQLGYIVATLNGIGIGRGDRVAVVLPGGPDLATVKLASSPGRPSHR